MPNHVSHKVQVSLDLKKLTKGTPWEDKPVKEEDLPVIGDWLEENGDNERAQWCREDQVQLFRYTRFNEEGDFDFQTVIPMPSSLGVEEPGTNAEMAHAAWHGADDRVGYWLRMPWAPERGITDRASLQSYVLQEYGEEGKAAGDRYQQNLEEHGATNWYDWCNKHWNTKWNAYDGWERGHHRWPLDTLEFGFQTAWSHPHPIFEKLTEMHPALIFDVVCFDEGWNFAGQGQYGGEDDFETVEANRDLYFEVYGECPFCYGEYPEEEDDEEGEYPNYGHPEEVDQ